MPKNGRVVNVKRWNEKEFTLKEDAEKELERMRNNVNIFIGATFMRGMRYVIRYKDTEYHKRDRRKQHLRTTGKKIKFILAEPRRAQDRNPKERQARMLKLAREIAKNKVKSKWDNIADEFNAK